MMRKKICIIGAASGQLPLCLKAKSMGLETHCFAWPKDAVCRNHVDYFYPISIFDMDAIVNKCRSIDVSGVVSNTSEATASVVSYVAEKLALPCTPYSIVCNIQNKYYVREKTNAIEGLETITVKSGSVLSLMECMPRPFVLKPITGSAKKGVLYVDYDTEISYDPDNADSYMAEQYISGQEYSIETISFRSKHRIVQVTEKVSSGAPHFVELEHHQPGVISETVRKKIFKLIPEILDTVGFENGAAHIEVKVDNDDNLYLIEINPRGGGDSISNIMVGLSTDFDYLRAMIEVSMGTFVPQEIHNVAYSGIYFLTAQTSRLLPFFEKDEEWIYDRFKNNDNLYVSRSNYDHNGYIIYKSDKRIII